MSSDLRAAADLILERIHPCAADAVSEALASYGIDSTSADAPEPPPPSSRTCAVALGYASHVLQGLVTVVATTDVWERAYVTGGFGERPSLSAIHDFAAELVNMVVGRVKRRYTRDGLDVEIALPVATSGFDLVVSRTAGVSRTTACTVGEATLTITSSLLLMAHAELVPDSGSDTALAEGDLMML